MSTHNANSHLQPESPSLEPSLSRSGIKLSLSSSLLTTTDLEPLVKGFAAELRTIVPCDGIEFVNTERKISVRDGEMRRHSCRYTLKIRDWIAGQMRFTRSRRFRKDELTLLETLLSELLFPLRRALTLRRAQTLPPNGAEDTTRVRSYRRQQQEPPLTAHLNRQPAVAPAAPKLSLVPLGEDGDYPSELTDSLLKDSEPTRFHSSTGSQVPFPQHDLAAGNDGNLDRKQRALLARAILRSEICEKELFREAREVLGYSAYSDEALVFMSVYSNQALTLSGDGPG